MDKVSSTKSIDKVLSPVTGMSCSGGLSGVSNDKSTVNFMVTNDHKWIFYLSFVDCPFKGRGWTSYDVFVNFPVITIDPVVNPKESSKSRLTWNDKFKK